MNNPAAKTDARLTAYAGDPALQTWLDASWRALQSELPGLVSSIETGDVTPLAAADVVVAGALRVLRNPDGAESTNYGIDDYREDVKHTDATQDVYFTAAELRRLSPNSAVAGQWSGSVKYC